MEKHTYVVAEGFSTINGKAVPKNREIELTDREALYDLSLGRIERKVKASAKGSGRKPLPEADDQSDFVTDKAEA
ncbi:MAG: hypothetical protein H6887_00675 [Hoeflea sp.]|nr:hypothetical protein [Hoeflea sp.]